MLELKGKTIMITGGTGSFGNALIDYLKGNNIHFVVYSRDESKQHDMFINRRQENITYIIGDIRDLQKLRTSMKHIDYVFHAAALKHVPTGEVYPEEVIKTNILGTKNVIEAADLAGVKKLIVLSTDKAAYPISAYGMSKALTEKLVSAYNGSCTNVCLRYGNVLGSRGSVVPVFLEQIKKGKLLTVTDYGMTRFVLTLDEAVRLALRCLDLGRSNELFIMKPAACTIKTLVEALELKYQRKLPVEIIGIRPGEKVDEVLLTGDEVYRSIDSSVDNIKYASITLKLFPDYHFTGEPHVEPEPFTSANAIRLTPEELLGKLMEAKLL